MANVRSKVGVPVASDFGYMDVIGDGTPVVVNVSTGIAYVLSSAGVVTSLAGGSGSVTSVAQSFTGGLISVAGSPITTSGTLALTVAGTSGGVPYFSSGTAWASSGALTASALVLGGGAAAAPATPLGLGTTITVLHGNAGGAPTWGAVSLTADVTGVLLAANGGTGTSAPSGTYTPTLTNVANIAASTAYECQYMRVGSVVTVSGKVDIDPTLTATSTQLGISLPVASNFGAAEDCAGVAFAPAISGMGAAIIADTTNDRAQLQYLSSDITNQAMYFSFSYQVI